MKHIPYKTNIGCSSCKKPIFLYYSKEEELKKLLTMNSYLTCGECLKERIEKERNHIENCFEILDIED